MLGSEESVSTQHERAIADCWSGGWRVEAPTEMLDSSFSVPSRSPRENMRKTRICHRYQTHAHARHHHGAWFLRGLQLCRGKVALFCWTIATTSAVVMIRIGFRCLTSKEFVQHFRNPKQVKANCGEPHEILKISQLK